MCKQKTRSHDVMSFPATTALANTPTLSPKVNFFNILVNPLCPTVIPDTWTHRRCWTVVLLLRTLELTTDTGPFCCCYRHLNSFRFLKSPSAVWFYIILLKAVQSPLSLWFWSCRGTVTWTILDYTDLFLWKYLNPCSLKNKFCFCFPSLCRPVFCSHCLCRVWLYEESFSELTLKMEDTFKLLIKYQNSCYKFSVKR